MNPTIDILIPKFSNATRGSAVLAAIMAVGLTGIVGAGMVATYDTYLRRARVTYVKAAMTSLDNKIRHLAMQPGAYTCGGADKLGGVQSCVLNETPFFDVVKNVKLAGACPAGPSGEATCGFRLEFDPAQPVAGLKRGFQVLNRGGVQTGVLFYALRYEGTDFQLRPGGQNWNNASDQVDQGMTIPREVLQSDDFDCAAVAAPAPVTGVPMLGAAPVFQGFDNRGKPICVPFTSCPTGQYVTAVDFRTMRVTCANLRTNDKTIRCSNYGQYKVSRVQWSNNVVVNGQSACSELPEAPLNGVIVPSCDSGGQMQSNGQCYYSNRWCRIRSANPNSDTLGYRAGDAGTRGPAGCNGDRFYQTGEVRADSGSFFKCLTDSYANYPLPDSMCPTTPDPACPAGQSRNAAGVCVPGASQLTWSLRAVSMPTVRNGLNLFQDPAGNLCGGGYQAISATSPPGWYSFQTPGNPADCPADIYAGGSCNTANSKCYYSSHSYGHRVFDGATAPFWADYADTCNYLSCQAGAVCPDGSPKTGQCPGTTGRWNMVLPLTLGQGSVPVCNVLEVIENSQNPSCSPVGKRCEGANPNYGQPNVLYECTPTQ